MGIKFPSTNGDTIVNDDHVLHAPKRRRIANDSPESAPNGILGHMLSERENDFEKALRVDVLQITHKDSSHHRSSNLLNGTGSPVKKDIPAIRVRCKLCIFRWRMREIKEVRILYCDSQICNLKVFRDADGACRRARIYLPSPFHVPAEKLCVELDDDEGFDLADHYLVQVELESAGDPSWPPVDLLPKEKLSNTDSSNPQHWTLTSSVSYKFEKHRVSAPVKIRKRADTGEDALDLSMDIDLRWSACHSASSVAEVEASPPEVPTSFPNGALEPLTNGHVNGRSDKAVSGPVKDEDVFIEEDEDHEEAATPSRSLRTREKQNYNLKLLSDKARGKERKERKQRKLAGARSQEAGQATWVLPRCGEVVLKGYQCIRCFGVHSSMNQLIEHVKVHSEFKYDFDLGSARIWVFPHGQEIRRRSSSSFLKVASSEDPESDLDDYVSPHKTQRTLAQSRSLLSSIPKDPRQLVPNNKQPMYDRLSKAILEPGTFVDQPDIDDTWLVQKHRDIIRDYSDVHPEEKEFISEWDAYVNKECVTSDPHLQGVYLKFIESKASWLVASQSRMTEFSKHMAYLKARNALAESTIVKALAIMRQARDQKRPDQSETTKPPSPRTEYRKSASGCAVCGQPIRGPSTLICSNVDCEKPLYHVDCIRKAAKVPVANRNWCCNSCCNS